MTWVVGQGERQGDWKLCGHKCEPAIKWHPCGLMGGKKMLEGRWESGLEQRVQGMMKGSRMRELVGKHLILGDQERYPLGEREPRIASLASRVRNSPLNKWVGEWVGKGS